MMPRAYAFCDSSEDTTAGGGCRNGGRRRRERGRREGERGKEKGRKVKCMEHTRDTNGEKRYGCHNDNNYHVTRTCAMRAPLPLL